MRIVLLDDYQSVALSSADWREVLAFSQIDVVTNPFDSPRLLVAALQPYEVVVAMRERTAFPREVLEQLPNLRLLVTTGMANSAIDLAACDELGITVSGSGSAPGSITAELTWALVLASAKRLDLEIASVRSGGWMTALGRGLAGKTLGVLGLGRIGSQVATYGRAFGMDVIAWSDDLTPQRSEEVGVRAVGWEEIFKTADIVTVHLPLSEETRGLVGEAELRSMKRNAWLVNTSRGPICDEDAILRACEQGWIGGAALDVFSKEPLPADHPFRTTKNIVATPHIGYVTEDSYSVYFEGVVDAIIAYHKGEPVRLLNAPVKRPS